MSTTTTTSTTQPTLSPEAIALQAVNAAAQALNNVGNAGTYPGIRGAIYQLVQQQSPDQSEGAFLNDLQCPIHIGLVGTADNLQGVQKEPVTIGCGHTFCRGCIIQVFTMNAQRRCPTCRTVMTVNPSGLARNHMIHGIVSRVKPPQQGGRKKTRKAKKIGRKK